MSYPSVITSFPQPTATSRLNNPSHSSLENLQSSTIGQIEALIGLEGSSSTLGTLMYDIRSPASNGGGHVQTANKGGTGQTIYSKGDILIGQSTSVLSKLAIGTDLQVLQADSTQSSGVKWAPVVANKVTASVTSASIAGTGTPLTVLYAASIVGSTLGNTNAIRFTGEIKRFGINPGTNFTLIANYGNNQVASVAAGTGITLGDTVNWYGFGRVTGMIVSNGTTNTQKGIIDLSISNNSPTTTSSVVFLFGSGSSSVESSANQNLVITGQFGGSSANNSILTGLFVVEKIQ